MKLYIRNMVCNRCVAVVKSELEKAKLHPLTVTMGQVELQEDLNLNELNALNKQLKVHGFELIDDKRNKILEQIKNIIIEQIHYTGEKRKVKYSELLAKQLGKDYSALSNLFSEMEGITIEQYIILQKTEKVKELLIYDELNLSQIADVLDYSSVAHLSAQFKKVTGLTPSQFKSLKENRRNPLDNVHSTKII
ncbi:MAG TPA: AraC family transcriptional regulator [Flavobacteriales bacterium]|nr:AraC family transcriptional regulator [Flavobacteriales bacterium]